MRLYVFTCMCMYMCMCMCMCMCMGMCMRMGMGMCMRMGCAYVYVYVYVHAYVDEYVYVNVYVHMYMYTGICRCMNSPSYKIEYIPQVSRPHQQCECVWAYMYGHVHMRMNSPSYKIQYISRRYLVDISNDDKVACMCSLQPSHKCIALEAGGTYARVYMCEYVCVCVCVCMHSQMISTDDKIACMCSLQSSHKRAQVDEIQKWRTDKPTHKIPTSQASRDPCPAAGHPQPRARSCAQTPKSGVCSAVSKDCQKVPHVVLEK